MTAPAQFTRYFESGGYHFTLDDLRSLASLLESEIGPQSEYDKSSRFDIRGKEWDFSCRSSEELQQVNVPPSILRAFFHLHSERGSAELDMQARAEPLLWATRHPTELGIRGGNRDWVLGASERVTVRLRECRVSWAWLYRPVAYYLALILSWLCSTVLVMILTLRLPMGFWRERAGGLSVFGGLVLGLLVFGALAQLYPNVTFGSPRTASRSAYRIALWAVLLGLVASAIWQLVMLLLSR